MSPQRGSQQLKAISCLQPLPLRIIYLLRSECGLLDREDRFVWNIDQYACFYVAPGLHGPYPLGHAITIRMASITSIR